MSVRELSCDVLVVGGGAAGLSAAVTAASDGAHVIIVEREDELGGILNQCIHNGFGLHRFGEELTGPEFAAKDIAKVRASKKIDVELGCSVLELKHNNGDLGAVISSKEIGLAHVTCGSIVLACGCRERTRGQINIAGGHPSGVFTAGSAQKMVNIEGAMVGKRVVILGSGDIGLIMARRMTWEGAKVLMVCELASEPGGLRRNIQQCLVDNDIPLYLSRTVTQVFGRTRLEAIELADVDPATMRPIPGTEERVECDTLLLSVGLIPENEVAKTIGIDIDRATSGPAVDQSLETSVPGVFVAGNELHVHDLADFVSEEGEQAGHNAAAYALRKHAATTDVPAITVVQGANVGSVTPQRISDPSSGATVRFRSRARVQGAQVELRCGDRLIKKARKMIVVPSEMQTVTLTPEDLEGVSGTIEVSVVEAPKSAGKVN